MFSFLDYVSQQEGIDNKGLYVVKLPYTAGGVLGDHPNIKRDCRGKDGIIEAIFSFLNHNPMVLGYIDYVMVQPQFPYTTEAEVRIMLFIWACQNCYPLEILGCLL